MSSDSYSGDCESRVVAGFSQPRLLSCRLTFHITFPDLVSSPEENTERKTEITSL